MQVNCGNGRVMNRQVDLQPLLGMVNFGHAFEAGQLSLSLSPSLAGWFLDGPHHCSIVDNRLKVRHIIMDRSKIITRRRT